LVLFREGCLTLGKTGLPLASGEIIVDILIKQKSLRPVKFTIHCIDLKDTILNFAFGVRCCSVFRNR
jgi:hypothetical protein